MAYDPTTALAPRYVFVGGLHRSGTTLVAGLLASGRGATGLVDTGVTENEGHHLHDVTPSAIDHGGPGRFAFDPALRRGRSSDPATDRRRLEAAWDRYWADGDAPVRIEKSPQHLLELPFLDSVFPDGHQVVVLRHPLTVALATRKWTRPGPPKLRRLAPRLSLERLVGHWLHAHHLFEQSAAPGERLHVIRYEDLVTDPHAVMTALATAVGIDGPPDTSSVRPSSGRYQADWDAFRRTGAGRRAERTWLPMAEAAMARWGYGTDDRLL